MCIVESIKDIRRSGTPLAAITTTDPEATVERIKSELSDTKIGFVSYDILQGFRGLNEHGINALKSIGEDDIESVKDSPTDAVLVATSKIDAGTMIFMHTANRYAEQLPFIQALKNARNPFCASRRTIILMGIDMPLPPELAGDVVFLNDPLPDEEDISSIVAKVADNYNKAVDKKGDDSIPKAVVTDEIMTDSIDALIGLPAFTAEQIASMCLRDGVFDNDSMWGRKRAQVETQQGLTIHRGDSSLKDVGGCENVVAHLTRCMNGLKHFSAIGFIDEIGTTGLASRMDSSGVNQDLEGHLLKYLQDNQIYAVLLAGLAGTGKSHICKVIGDHFGKPTIGMDLGAMKGRFVGDSERLVRGGFDVLTAASHGRPLIIATCNGSEGLSSALLSRFSKIFYFDLPTREEKDAIWNIKMAQYGITDQPIPDDALWVGRNIDKCCEEAWMLETTLEECAESIIPVGRSASSDLSALRAQANGRYLSAAEPGIYSTSTVIEDRVNDLTI